MSTKRIAMASSASQAPWVNFVITMITSTMLVSEPPTVLMICERRICRRALRVALGAQLPVPVPHHAPLADLN